LPKELIIIIQACLQTDPNRRPNAEELEERFRKLLEDKKLLSSSKFNHPYQTNLQFHPSVSLTSKL